jgi:hypothetical protein
MPWHCPACQEQIRHAHEIQPSVGVVYRCHICRLELVLDAKANQLIVRDLRNAEGEPPPTRAIRSKRRQRKNKR